MFSKGRIISLFIGTAVLMSVSCNPFAPAYDPDGLKGSNFLGDRHTIDGLFTYFKNSYELRDTSLYSRLFTPDFTFTYFDFDQNANVSWDKGEELNLSYNLFRSVNSINLDWNFYVRRDSIDPLNAQVTRNFNLTIVENEQTVHTGSGRARITLRRDREADPWKISFWFDDSDF